MGMKVIMAVVMLLSINMRALASFAEDLVVSWGNDRLKMEEGGQQWQLTLDKGSGSGFQSKKEYLLADIEMQIKLISGNSAGTVTAYYLSSQGTNHDEIDFEFLGNVSGQPYIMHTNVFSQGKGGREQQFYLWFDPTADFHKYAVSWTSESIVFSVDGVPVRVFRNREKEIGVAYPHTQSMRMFCSLWDADDWATRGGLVKTDWSVAPFVASFKAFKGTAQSNTMATDSDVDKGKLNWVRSNYLVYDYCLDTKRFPQGPPPECRD